MKNPLDLMPKYHIISVEPLDGYNLRLTFKDGASGIVDITKRIPSFTGVFVPLQDLDYFRQVKIDPVCKTICWENGTDLDPLVLYCLATGQPIPGEEVEQNLLDRSSE